MMKLEYTIAILSLLAALIPIFVSWYDKRDKLKKTVYLIELIKTKDQLKELIEDLKTQSNTTIIIEKLHKNLEEIEGEIYASQKRKITNAFLIFISIEIFLIFSIYSESVISKLHFLEGIFESSTSQMLLFFLIVMVSYIATFQISKKKWFKFKNQYKKNAISIIVFNLILMLLSFMTYKVLDSLDIYTNLF